MDLTDQPGEELRAEPGYAAGPARYATITLGTGADNKFTVALTRQGDQSAIYVDANNDEDLTNDGDGKWAVDHPTNWLTTVTLQVPYAGDGGETTLPYQVVFYYFKDQFPEKLIYYRDTAFRTTLDLGGQPCTAALLDENCDGRLDDLEATGAFVDADGDGEFCPGESSHEHFGPGEPFNVGGETYRLAAVAPDGSSVTVEKTGPVPAKADLRPGRPAPDFEAVDTAGQPVSPADFRGKVLLLDFWASWCGPCKDEMPNVIAAYGKLHDQGFEILGVSLDEARTDMDAYLAEQPEMKWRQVCDEQGWEAAVGQVYRVQSIPASFLLDREGRIYQTDLRGEALAAAVEELLKQ